MKIEEVEYIARLARLSLDDKEKQKYAGQLSKILDHMGHLNALKTDAVEPTSHPLPLNNVWREDEVKPSLPVEEALRNAPAQDRGFFKVPRIMD